MKLLAGEDLLAEGAHAERLEVGSLRELERGELDLDVPLRPIHRVGRAQGAVLRQDGPRLVVGAHQDAFLALRVLDFDLIEVRAADRVQRGPEEELPHGPSDAFSEHQGADQAPEGDQEGPKSGV